MQLASGKHAEKALACVSFVESSVFPIPPDVMLIPMVLSARQKWLRIATICTVASIFGALAGYAIGAFLFDVVGEPILNFLGKEEALHTLSDWYAEWGGLAILFAAVTPFPYKVVTIFSGFTGFNIFIFVIASIIGRAGRFFLVAWLLNYYGTPIRNFIEERLGILFTIAMSIIILAIIIFKVL
jgi:membrane protein YqaA with SNARE-associated domain